VLLSLSLWRADEPALAETPHPLWPSAPPFDRLVEGWFPLTYALNNLNRGLWLG